MLEHGVPSRSRVLGVEVEVSLLHAGLDVRRAAAHALRQLHLEVGVVLDQRVQHLAEDVLLGHGLRGDVHHVLSTAAVRERERPARYQHHGCARGDGRGQLAA